jgi:gamma-glutamyltranspeptidase/glutathione hydrolase/leukotriene-C4 hydrolase
MKYKLFMICFKYFYYYFIQLLQNLTSKSYAAEVQKRIDDTTTNSKPEHYGAVSISTEDHGTAHISVLAENGDAVSVTSSVNL